MVYECGILLRARNVTLQSALFCLACPRPKVCSAVLQQLIDGYLLNQDKQKEKSMPLLERHCPWKILSCLLQERNNILLRELLLTEIIKAEKYRGKTGLSPWNQRFWVLSKRGNLSSSFTLADSFSSFMWRSNCFHDCITLFDIFWIFLQSPLCASYT